MSFLLQLYRVEIDTVHIHIILFVVCRGSNLCIHLKIVGIMYMMFSGLLSTQLCSQLLMVWADLIFGILTMILRYYQLPN